MNNKLYILLFFLICITLISCDPSLKETPSQIKIDQYEVNTYLDQGTSLQRFTDLYVYENEVFSGAYPIPATIATLSGGTVDLIIYPGIRENGFEMNRIIYPMMEVYRADILTNPFGAVHLKPVFEYKRDTKFKLIDEFENETQFTDDLDGDPETTFTFVEGIEGYCGKILLDKEHSEWETSNSTAKRQFPYDGTPIYLEMHYKSDVELQVGLIGWSPNIDKSKHFKIALHPSSNWNKIYINFTPEIQNSELEYYQIVFKATYSGNRASEEIALDNVKWLHL